MSVGKIAKISTSGVVTEYSLPYPGPGSLPLGIATGPDGNLWFTLGSNAVNAIGRITPSGTISEFPISTPNSGPVAITSGPDGNLWFTEEDSGFIGRITPTGVITKFPLPTSTPLLRGITAGPDGNLWFTEYFTGKIGSITTNGVVTEYTTPTASSEPWGITAGPDGNIWFTESNANKIGRVNLKGPQALNYVAMGDSFSSGEGNPPFITGPDYNTNTDGCHRSVQAYPALLGRTASLHLKLTFVACSGATSTQIMSGMHGEPSQLNAINSTTDIVTLTAGGDDIGFADFARACVLLRCDSGTSIYHTTLNNITNKLPTLLRTLYQAIKAKIGTKTRVLVVGYPMMLSSSSDLVDCNNVTVYSRRAAEYIIAKLNLTIMYAVKAAGSQFTYVSASKPNSPFNGHPLCSSISYFNDVALPPNVVYSFHPNALGQQAYAEIIKPYLG